VISSHYYNINEMVIETIVTITKCIQELQLLCPMHKSQWMEIVHSLLVSSIQIIFNTNTINGIDKIDQFGIITKDL
jgi:hypothetical protein